MISAALFNFCDRNILYFDRLKSRIRDCKYFDDVVVVVRRVPEPSLPGRPAPLHVTTRLAACGQHQFSISHQTSS